MASTGPCPHKFFEFLKKNMHSRLFFVLLTQDPMAAKTLLLQITFESHQTFCEFSSLWFSQKYNFKFLNFSEFDILKTFVLVFVNMEPYGSQRFKMLLLQNFPTSCNKVWDRVRVRDCYGRMAKKTTLWIDYNVNNEIYSNEWTMSVSAVYVIAWCIQSAE